MACISSYRYLIFAQSLRNTSVSERILRSLIPGRLKRVMGLFRLAICLFKPHQKEQPEETITVQLRCRLRSWHRASSRESRNIPSWCFSTLGRTHIIQMTGCHWISRQRVRCGIRSNAKSRYFPPHTGRKWRVAAAESCGRERHSDSVHLHTSTRSGRGVAATDNYLKFHTSGVDRLIYKDLVRASQ